MGYVKTAEKRYVIEVIAALALFFVAGWLTHTASHMIADPGLLLAIKLFPLVPILLIAAAVWRFFRNCDELQRQTIMKTSAAAGMLSLTVLLIWPILRAVGLPQPTGKSVILVMAGSYLVCGATIRFLAGRADGGVKRGLIWLIPLAVMLAMIGGLYQLLFLLHVRNQTLGSAIWIGGGAVAILTYRLLKQRLEP